MKSMKLAIIAAVADNRVIGKDGRIPWHLPEDMAHFKNLTMGHPVIMGRKTYESIPEKFRPLKGRLNVIVTHNRNYAVPRGVQVVSSFSEALRCMQQEEIIYVIGGQQLYEQALLIADRLEITEVHQSPAGDAFFPPIDPARWKEVKREETKGYSFVTYAKRKAKR